MLSFDLTRKEHRDEIAQRCAHDFARHELIPEGDRRWLCRHPHTSINSFRVILAPHLIIVAGDIGDAILTVSDRDPAGWLWGPAQRPEYPDYVLGKVSRPERCFLTREAARVLSDLEQDGSRGTQFASSLRTELSELSLGLGEDLAGLQYEDWRAAWWALDEFEVPNCEDWSPETLGIWHALCLFVRLLDAQAKTTTPAEVPHG